MAQTTLIRACKCMGVAYCVRENFTSPLKPLIRLQNDLAEMIPGRPSTKKINWRGQFFNVPIFKHYVPTLNIFCSESNGWNCKQFSKSSH